MASSPVASKRTNATPGGLKIQPTPNTLRSAKSKQQQVEPEPPKRKYSKVSLARNWKFIQAHPDKRWMILLQIRNILQSYPQQTTFENLRQVMRVKGDLGKGVYGKVYEMKVRSREQSVDYMPYTFALKLVQVHNTDKFDRSSTIEKIMREIQAFGYTNGLVYLRICPNFTLAPRTFFAKVVTTAQQSGETKKMRSSFCCMIVMERESGTYKEWLVANGANAPVNEILGHVLQMFMGIAALAKHLEMCHNDLYFKNVLYSTCQPVNIKYILMGSTFYVPNSTLNIKISDFGIATSPKVLRIGHTELGHLVTKKLALSSFTDFDFSNHILDYANIPPYARDSAVVLRSLSKTQHINPRLRTWADYGLKMLDKYSAAGQLSDWDLLLQFIIDLFNPKTLGACELDELIFSGTNTDPGPKTPASLFPNSDGTLVNTETFCVDGQTIGTDVQVSRMLTNFVSHYHT